MSMVTWSPSAAGRSTVELAELGAEALDLGVDVVVGDLGLGTMTRRLVVAGRR